MAATRTDVGGFESRQPVTPVNIRPTGWRRTSLRRLRVQSVRLVPDPANGRRPGVHRSQRGFLTRPRDAGDVTRAADPVAAGGLNYLNARTITPAATMAMPAHSRKEGRSPKNATAKMTTSTRLSLSTGATFEASPTLSARK